MKCVTVSIFKDKNDGTIYSEGDELEVTAERFKEINSTPAGVLVKKIIDENNKNVGDTTPGKETNESVNNGAGTADKVTTDSKENPGEITNGKEVNESVNGAAGA